MLVNLLARIELTGNGMWWCISDALIDYWDVVIVTEMISRGLFIQNGKLVMVIVFFLKAVVGHLIIILLVMLNYKVEGIIHLD